MNRAAIGTHPSCDRPDLYAFPRSSGLPADYFRKRRLSPDRCVFIALAVFLVIGIVAVNF